MLDSNVFDRLLLRPDVVGELQELVDSGMVELLTTHVQREELSAIRDEGERARRLALLSSLTVEVPAGGFVWDVSPWGAGKWMGDTEAAAFDHDLRTPQIGLADPGEPRCGDPATHEAAVNDPEGGGRCPRCETLMRRDRRTGDALIIETAAVENARFVTSEKEGEQRSALERARRHGVRVMHSDDFFAWVLGQRIPPGRSGSLRRTGTRGHTGKPAPSSSEE